MAVKVFKVVPLEKEEVRKLALGLAKLGGRYHAKHKGVDGVTYYAICEALEDNSIWGRLSSPWGNHGIFHVRQVNGKVILQVTPDEDSTAPAFVLVNHAWHALKSLTKRVEDRKKMPDEIGTSRWKGFYMQKAKTPIGKVKARDLHLAHSEEEVSASFVSDCLRVGITMIKYPRQKSK